MYYILCSVFNALSSMCCILWFVLYTCLRFANKCLKNYKVKNFFPKKEKLHKMKKRKEQKFVVNKANTKRYKRSAIPYMQNLLNLEDDRKHAILNSFR